MIPFNRERALQSTRGRALAKARRVLVGNRVEITALETAEGKWLPVAILQEDQGWLARRIAEKDVYPHMGPIQYE